MKIKWQYVARKTLGALCVLPAVAVIRLLWELSSPLERAVMGGSALVVGILALGALGLSILFDDGPIGYSPPPPSRLPKVPPPPPPGKYRPLYRPMQDGRWEALSDGATPPPPRRTPKPPTPKPQENRRG